MTFPFMHDLRVDDALRKELSGPFGKIMSASQIKKTISKNSTIYAVGDVTLATLLRLGYKPKIGIFDRRSERGRVYFGEIEREYKDPLLVKNRRGSLGRDLWIAVECGMKSKKPTGIRVFGEEDLASLPCVYLARSNEIVMYGLRNRGVAVIKVNSKLKAYVRRVLKRMSEVSDHRNVKS